jgi:uncharacterized protein (TIGR03663 family)
LPEVARPRDIEEWRLGIELGEHAETPAEPPPEPPPAEDHAVARLERAVYVVTAERAAWLALALFALATRLAALDLRPLAPDEAREALLELELATHGLAAAAQHASPLLSWVPLAQAFAFSTLGASDITARLVVALGGLLLVASAFAMRPFVGRAGAIALAALLVLSPSITYSSRSGDWRVVALGFVMLALVLAMRTMHRPRLINAAALGLAVGLALAADPAALSIGAIFAVILAAIGAWDAVAIGNPVLRFKVWWERRRWVALAGAAIALIVWAALATALSSYSFLTVVVESVRANLAGLAEPGYAAAMRLYGPLLGFYEFVIAILAVVGLVAVVARRGWSRFPLAMVAWMLLALAVYPLVAAHQPSSIVIMLVPMALVAALGIEHLYRARGWRAVRVAIAIVGALGLYVQVLTNFIYATPEAGAAPWARHALLFWRKPATTDRARIECILALRAMRGEAATVFVSDGMPAMNWYLRGVAPAESPDYANIAVAPLSTDPPAQAPPSGRRYEFILEESWEPDPRTLDSFAALRFFFTARVWNRVQLREAAITVRTPTAPTAPTVILTPAPEPSSDATPAMPEGGEPPATP